MNVFWTMAREAEEEARLLFDNAKYRGAASRAYYAMFNAARALLELHGFEQANKKTHASILTQFAKEFVRTGLFPQDVSKALWRAENARYGADYDGEVALAEDMRALIQSMEAFMQIAAVCLDDSHSGGQE